jgi:hypothetical protein
VGRGRVELPQLSQRFYSSPSLAAVRVAGTKHSAWPLRAGRRPIRVAISNMDCGRDGWESNPPRTPQKRGVNGFIADHPRYGHEGVSDGLRLAGRGSSEVTRCSSEGKQSPPRQCLVFFDMTRVSVGDHESARSYRQKCIGDGGEVARRPVTKEAHVELRRCTEGGVRHWACGQVRGDGAEGCSEGGPKVEKAPGKADKRRTEGGTRRPISAPLDVDCVS